MFIIVCQRGGAEGERRELMSSNDPRKSRRAPCLAFPPITRPSSTRAQEELLPHVMSTVSESIPPSCRSLLMNFSDARSWPRWSCVKGSWKLGQIPSIGVTTQLRTSTYPTHSGGLTIGPSISLFDVPFDSTME